MANFFANYPSSNSGNSIIVANIEVALKAIFPTAITGKGLYHAAGTNNITGSFTEVSGSGNGSVPSGTKNLQISSNIGVPIMVSVAATVGAAPGSTEQLAIVEGGGPLNFAYTFTAGDKLWVKTLDGSTASSSDFVVNFTG